MTEVEAPQKKETGLTKRTRHWLGPLIAGSCMATGYIVTNRVRLRQTNWQRPTMEFSHAQAPFPGVQLKKTRQTNSSQNSKVEAQKTNPTRKKPATQLPSALQRVQLAPEPKNNRLKLLTEQEKAIQAAMRTLQPIKGESLPTSVMPTNSRNRPLKPPSPINSVNQTLPRQPTFNELFRTLSKP